MRGVVLEEAQTHAGYLAMSPFGAIPSVKYNLTRIFLH